MEVTIYCTILMMAGITYITRVTGFLAFRNRVFSPAARSVMDAAPGCVLIALIAPKFVTGDSADLMALAITIFAATRLSMLPVVMISIVVTWGLRAVGHV